jgi:D-3-phosphoglycerate dehydrogenase
VKILLLETIHDEAVSLLAEVGEVRMIESLDAGHVRQACVDATAVLTRGRGRIPREALIAGRALRCVARCGAGTDNIDVAAATELGVPVLFSPDGTTFAVAEHTLMLMLAVSRRLTFLDRAVKCGQWEVRSRIGLGADLYGKTLGIVGLGRIGRRIAELGEAFGMRVGYWSARSRDERYTCLELAELFRAADVLSLSLSLNEETRGLVSAPLLALMKPSAIFINTARGELVDEAALTEALLSGRIAGAGMDVMASEPPPPDHPLFGLDQVIFTPHVAVLTDVAYRRMCVEVAAQVVRVLRGERPDERFVRNRPVLSGHGWQADS